MVPWCFESVGGAAGEKQVPFGNGRKKSKCNSRFLTGMEDKKSKNNSRFPSGMEERKQVKQQIPTGMEDKKSNNVKQRMRR